MALLSRGGTSRQFRSGSMRVRLAGLFLLTSALACEVSTSSSNAPSPTPTKPTAPAKPMVQRPVAKPTAPAKRPDDVVEVEGLRFTINPVLSRQGKGRAIDVQITVEAIDGKAHVIYGLSKGVAFGGIRFGKAGGGMPMQEGGKVTRYGRVKPGAPLKIGRSFPGDPAPGGGWEPLVEGDSLVLALKTWHTLGETATGEPRQLDIGAVSVTVDDNGRARFEINQPRAK